jgi:DNA (cytosine-5)-methyltransferase 1
MNELIVDNFAGGGGASLGIEQGLGRPVDFAINHDAEAVAMHRANHPLTRHFCESVWDVDPRTLSRGRQVGLGWFSPDCTFHSKARGGKPFRDRNRARRVRGLAWLVVRWAKAVRPRVIMLENVEEFADWGPLLPDGRPCPQRRGMTFRRWHRQIENLGYSIDMRELRACDYGAPTTRRRLFVIARCDGQEIVFPEASHGHGGLPYRTAAECIDWSIPCPSIFTRERPLAEATLRRIARGVMRYVVDSARPFIVSVAHGDSGGRREYPIEAPLGTISGGGVQHAMVSPLIARIGQTGGRGIYANDIRDPLTTVTTKAEHLLVAPALINTRNGEREGQEPRVRDILQPYPTVTAIGSQGALVAAFLAKHYGGHETPGTSAERPFDAITARDHHALVSSHILKLKGTCKDGHAATEPLHTIQAGGTHYGEVRAFLLKYYGTDQDPRLNRPLDTITSKDRFGLVTVNIAGEPYAIVDIGMRMLAARELYRAQSFPDRYIIDPDVNGKPLTKTAQVRMCGNSVPPLVAEALVRANVSEQRKEQAA